MTKSGASRLRLSILDQSPISEGSTLGTALRNSIDLAVLAESTGYHRYWVAEHHGSPGLGCMSPEILIEPIAAATSRIRVGSGGVMLPHYSPFKVAESFSMLASLFPGRIDLGVGRASGTDRTTALALQRDRRKPPADDFPDQLAELISYCGPAEQRRAQGMPQASLVTHERPPSGSSDRLRRAPSGRLTSVSPTHLPTSSMRMAAKMRSPSTIASSSRPERSNRNRRLPSPCGRFARRPTRKQTSLFPVLECLFCASSVANSSPCLLHRKRLSSWRNVRSDPVVRQCNAGLSSAPPR